MADLLAGKKAFVIGGSGGAGAAVSRALAAEGAVLAVHGGKNGGKLDSLVKELSEFTEVEGILCPLDPDFFRNEGNDSRSVEFMRHVRESDIICICYGPFLQKPVDETAAVEWNEIVSQNLELPGIIVSTALAGMKKRHWGRIILFGGTGTTSFRGYRTNAVYSAAKTGLCNLVKSVAVEYSQYGITCNAILPGFTDTEFVPEDVKEIQRQKMPLGCLIRPEELAESAVFLMKMGCINGALLNVDQGWAP